MLREKGGGLVASLFHPPSAETVICAEAIENFAEATQNKLTAKKENRGMDNDQYIAPDKYFQ